MGTWIKYIGNAAQRIVTHDDLANLGADLSKVEHVAENDVLSFMRNAAVKVEAEVAHILTTHPSLTGEFIETTDPAGTPATSPTEPLDPNATPSAMATGDTSPTPANSGVEATTPATAPAAEEVAPNAGSAS